MKTLRTFGAPLLWGGLSGLGLFVLYRWRGWAAPEDLWPAAGAIIALAAITGGFMATALFSTTGFLNSPVVRYLVEMDAFRPLLRQIAASMGFWVMLAAEGMAVFFVPVLNSPPTTLYVCAVWLGSLVTALLLTKRYIGVLITVLADVARRSADAQAMQEREARRPDPLLWGRAASVPEHMS